MQAACVNHLSAVESGKCLDSLMYLKKRRKKISHFCIVLVYSKEKTIFHR
jgi:hypothetical protein